MRFGIIANFGRPDAAEAVNFILEWCENNGHEAFVCENVVTGPMMEVRTVPRKELCVNSDAVISLGGDGTMLATARAIAEQEIPILGINLGYLGFLTQLTPEQLGGALKRVAANDYQIEERMLLKTNVIDGPQLDSQFALNDVVIDKGAVSRVINLSLYANDEYICSYTADGLIVATPTGSTAYSLAVGGPILNPNMNAFIASPISPFSLTSRPMVFPADVTLEVRIRSEHGNANLTVDGQVATNFSPTGTIRITRARHVVKFIKFEEFSFYDILRRKLHWGRLPVVDYEKADLLKKTDRNNRQ
ncbi:MAG: NAD(+) kinase [candidate division Zixibacteria bacterium HGW-Zixibacteria-1]|nr:MAG: NAD(+) kinase [candidate division Zixibacteria bacterium HGW-Zixibacteria-1]